MSLIKNLKTINKIAISNYFHRETQKGGHIQNAEQLFVQPRHIPTCNRDFKKRTITRMVLCVIAFPLRLLTREKFVITLQKLRGTRSAARTA